MSRFGIPKLMILVTAVALPLTPFGASARQLSVPLEYATISSAVSSAIPFDTIVVDSGTYSGPGFFDIQIRFPLHITSRYGRDKTVINCAGVVVFWGLPWTIPDTANYTWSLSGITVRNATRAVWVVDRHSRLNAANCRFTNCGEGINVRPESQVSELWVDSCAFDSNATAIRIYNEIYTTISHTTFIYNDIGLLSELGSYPEVRHCTFRDHLTYAISTDFGTICNISNNLFLNDSVAVHRNGYGAYFWTVACNDVFGTDHRYEGFPDQTGYDGNISLDPELCSPNHVELSIASLSPLRASNNDCHADIGFVTGVGCYCGDVDANGAGPDIGDLTRLIDFLFVSFTPIVPPEAGEINGAGSVDIGDLTILIDNLFVSNAPLPCGPSATPAPVPRIGSTPRAAVPKRIEFPPQDLRGLLPTADSLHHRVTMRLADVEQSPL